MPISAINTVRLVRIERDGTLSDGSEVSEAVQQICRSGIEHFNKVGFQAPWVGYLAFDGAVCVGACAFKSPPKDGAVEISYCTFEGFRDQGYATAMVQRLINLARSTDPAIAITAQTLPERNASTRVLTKAGFILLGDLVNPEDGLVWEWRLL